VDTDFTDSIHATAELSYESAPDFCRAVTGALDEGSQRVLLDLETVERVDVVGLAALVQCVGRFQRNGVRCMVRPGRVVHRAAFDAGLLDMFPVVAAPVPERGSRRRVTTLPPPMPRADLARTRRLGLRAPSGADLKLFDFWAKEPLLDHLVGSELLYRCRHLGASHSEFAEMLFGDPAALTVVVESTDPPVGPVGFVRFFGINLAQGYAFVECAMADERAIRRGLGVEATRLLSFYALDVLGLRRLEAKVYAYNTLSINALRRNGFQQEGVLRHARTCEGRTWDILIFAILEDEIRAQRRKGDWPYMGFWE